MSRNMWALFFSVLFFVSFCGGPLFVADLLKPGFGVAGFLAAIAPLMIALLGAFSFMELDPIGIGPQMRSRLGSRAVLAGLAGLMITGLMNAFAFWRLAMSEAHPDRSLIMTGIVAGTVLSVGYVYLAWRYLRMPRAPKAPRKKHGTLPFLAPRPAAERATFTFTGRDSLSQFIASLVLILGAGCIPIPLFVWWAGGMTAATTYILAALAVVIGLRSSIVVTPSLVFITRSWFPIPYWRYSGHAIQDVCYGGDWGDPEGACGVVIKLDGQEIHIGSAKTMHHLHASLWPMRARLAA
jgi:MFS family permease